MYKKKKKLKKKIENIVTQKIYQDGILSRFDLKIPFAS